MCVLFAGVKVGRTFSRRASL